MVKFKVGDKVMIANTRGIMFGRDYFKDGDITEVLQVEDGFEPGSQTIDVLVTNPETVDDATDFIGGKPALYISSEEFIHIVKLKEDNK